MARYRTVHDPAGSWTDENVVVYDLKRDLYWVPRQFLLRVQRLVGLLNQLPDYPHAVLDSEQVDWLHDHGYIVA